MNIRRSLNSYSYWKVDSSLKPATCLYIGGLKVAALRAVLMTNWQACKYESLIALQNDDAKNNMWRSAAVNIPRNSSSTTTQNMGKAHVPIPIVQTPSRQYWSKQS